MSEDDNKGESADSGPVGGERLRAARRANDISVRDVAKELHIDEPKVRALEKNEFEKLGAPVFAKGHLRKYAEMVGVPIDDVMTDYYQLTRSTGTAGSPPLVGSVSKPNSDINLAPWIVAILLLLIGAAGLYWWFELRDDSRAAPPIGDTSAPFSSPRTRNEATVEPASEPAAEETQGVATSAGELMPEPQSSGETAPAAAESTGAASIGAASTEQPAPATVRSDDSDVALVLSYSGNCWTEVSDATGRQLFYDLAPAGRVLNLRGEAPLRVILGDAANVSVTVDGAAWAIPASAQRGRLARFTINAP